MNENINLVEILKDCPEGTELYSAIHGKVFIQCVKEKANYPIKVYMPGGDTYAFTKEGKAYNIYDGECVLFPSKDQRDWSKFKTPIERFNPKNFKPFDKVLVQTHAHWDWVADIVSHYRPLVRQVVTVRNVLYTENIIPYNEETCDLIGTNADCPEYYKWWKNE